MVRSEGETFPENRVPSRVERKLLAPPPQVGEHSTDRVTEDQDKQQKHLETENSYPPVSDSAGPLGITSRLRVQKAA